MVELESTDAWEEAGFRVSNLPLRADASFRLCGSSFSRHSQCLDEVRWPEQDEVEKNRY